MATLARVRPAPRPTAGAIRCRRKFLRFFPGGFRDEKYVAWERGYKWAAHIEWEELLPRAELRRLLLAGRFQEIAARAVGIEARTNLLFSFEKMALRDAVKTREGARTFARGIYDLLHGAGDPARKFDRWCAAVAELPRKQTRVLTWPVVTVFPFLAQPDQHVFLKPVVTTTAAKRYGRDFAYASRP